MLLPERSSLSRFLHSPTHPRSNMPRLLNLRIKIDSNSNFPAVDFNSAGVIFVKSESWSFSLFLAAILC
uniref:Uncharacterized protein n=1 Tax=Anguilla anguilla TaxID=7936 RepID=A0A0E9UYY1_ANGAN